MDQSPAATVIIPTRNRKEYLRNAIRSSLSQTVPVEVIVLDDGSTDGSQEMVKNEFPGVKFEQFQGPNGPCLLRNRGCDLASTPFLITLDDDCVLQSSKTVEQTLALFDHPRIGAVTIPFINTLQDSIERFAAPTSSGTHITSMYYGGMIAFRRDAYIAAGKYRTNFFMHVEEPDLSIRLLDTGYVIRLGSADPIHHLESPVRNRTRLHGLGPRNHILYAWYNVPNPYLIPQMLGTTALCLKHGLKQGTTWLVIKGLFRGFGRSLAEWSRRKPVRAAVYRLNRRMKSGEPLSLEDVMQNLPDPSKSTR